MRPRFALGLVCLLALAGCGGGPPSPESVVRAWSQALNSNDNEHAADLFAKDARVVQGGRLFRLTDHSSAVSFNASLPCTGRILSVATDGENATATFLLGNRPGSQCDGPGQTSTAVFTVHQGKIVLWHETASATPNEPAV